MVVTSAELGNTGDRDGLGRDRRAKHGREEPPHVGGQGQKTGGPHAQRAAAKRSYPMSEVRGSGQEYQTAMAQERRRGATPCPGQGRRPEGATPSPHARGQGRWPGGPTPRPRSRHCAGAGGPRGATSSHPEVRGGCREEIPSVRGQGRRREELPHAPKPEARSGGREDLPHARMPEARGSGREEQPMPEARGGAGRTNPMSGPRGAIPR